MAAVQIDGTVRRVAFEEAVEPGRAAGAMGAVMLV